MFLLEKFKPIAEICALSIELIGVFIIAVTAIICFGQGLYRLLIVKDFEHIYKQIRQRLGKGILLGLEFLVAADIIHTVVVDLSFQSITVLAIIVVIRTFLSFTLELELYGQWPWKKKSSHQ